MKAPAIDLSTKSRLNASADFADQIKPILADYAADNNIDMIIQKYNNGTNLDITNEI